MQQIPQNQLVGNLMGLMYKLNKFSRFGKFAIVKQAGVAFSAFYRFPNSFAEVGKFEPHLLWKYTRRTRNKAT